MNKQHYVLFVTFLMSILFFVGARDKFNAVDVADMKDSYGREWTYDERMRLQRKAISGYFLGIVVTQVADAIICKTRKLSLFQQGMMNWHLNFALVFEVALAALVVYCPHVNTTLGFEHVEYYLVLPAVPYALFIIVYDEIRKFIIRRRPKGWVERETYY